MGKFYNVLAGNKKFAAPARLSYRLWWRCLAVVFMLCCTMQFASSQIVTEGPAVRANFGIDADVYTNYLLAPELDTIDPFGTDDWFGGLYSGDGTAVFNPSPAFITYINNRLAIDENLSFVIRMGDNGWISRNSELEIPSSPGDTIVWVDGVYARDNNTAGNGKDSTAFGGTSDKNFQDPSTWDAGIKDPYQKGDLIDVYGHMREDPDGDLWGIGAFSTRSTSGSVHADFEFFANQVGFDGSHFSNTGTDHGHTSWTFDSAGVVLTAGDLIVSIDYEKGGDLPVASIRVWVSEADYIYGLANWGGSASFNFTGAFTAESGVGFGYAEIEPAVGNTDPAAWAVVNVDSVSPAPPWGTLEGPQAANDSVYLPLQFAEFAINMSFLGLDAFGGDACNKTLGSLLVKTRSSPSFESEMHDFVGPLLFGYDLETKIVTTDLDSCDDGVNQFDLTTAVDSTGDGVVTFYATSADAFANPPVNAISSIQTLPVGDTMFWARSSNPDDQGCFAVDSFHVIVHDLPVCNVTIQDESYFNADNGYAVVNVTGGSGSYTYLWGTDGGSIGGGQGTDSIYGLSDGIYFVTVTDSFGCETSCVDTIRWTPTAPTCEVFTEDVECYGAETGIAWAEVTPSDTIGYPPYKYIWYKDAVPFDTTITASLVDTMFNLGAGIYDVEIFNNVDPNSTFCSDTIFQPDPNPVYVECSSLTVDECLGQDSINTAFGNWLDTVFMVSGGTDPLDTIYKINGVEVDIDTVSAPYFCGDSKTIQMIVSDYCGLADTCDATFAVNTPVPVSLTPPANDTLDACSTGAEIASAFSEWLGSVSYDGGCNATIDNGNPTAPDSCGGEITVVWTVSSDCESDVMDSAVFVVTAAPAVSLTPPANDTLDACSTGAEIASAFSEWLGSVSYDGGCNATIDNGNPTAPDSCGGEITVVWTVSSDCESDVMDSAVFVVT
ncbi:SprB repeat-containing protein, partial [Maribellus sediminis]|uniref:SprB repeat-containing protein n=1 Tax=Maribellus sediminis TaxID=2696285 RepID=UPI00143185B2